MIVREISNALTEHHLARPEDIIPCTDEEVESIKKFAKGDLPKDYLEF